MPRNIIINGHEYTPHEFARRWGLLIARGLHYFRGTAIRAGHCNSCGHNFGDNEFAYFALPDTVLCNICATRVVLAREQRNSNYPRAEFQRMRRMLNTKSKKKEYTDEEFNSMIM